MFCFLRLSCSYSKRVISENHGCVSSLCESLPWGSKAKSLTGSHPRPSEAEDMLTGRGRVIASLPPVCALKEWLGVRDCESLMGKVWPHGQGLLVLTIMTKKRIALRSQREDQKLSTAPKLQSYHPLSILHYTFLNVSRQRALDPISEASSIFSLCYCLPVTVLFLKHESDSLSP